ncbi:hypothetical protein [Paraconexibacter sp. AEG42_29]|uniref:hypothetical protein n=1 Tax=Paraconexibacter sp. AEG42_29 TaxID=2997339 RepID=UPI00339D9DF7
MPLQPGVLSLDILRRPKSAADGGVARAQGGLPPRLLTRDYGGLPPLMRPDLRRGLRHPRIWFTPGTVSSCLQARDHVYGLINETCKDSSRVARDGLFSVEPCASRAPGRVIVSGVVPLGVRTVQLKAGNRTVATARARHGAVLVAGPRADGIAWRSKVVPLKSTSPYSC